MRQGKKGIPCKNPNCPGGEWILEPIRKKANIFKGALLIDEQKIEIVFGPSVKATCSRCGHEMKAWIPNRALVDMAVAIESMDQRITHMGQRMADMADIATVVQEIQEQLSKPFYKKWFPFLFQANN